MERGQSDELIAVATEERIGADNECVDSRLDDGAYAISLIWRAGHHQA
jgi:hypothetical protein